MPLRAIVLLGFFLISLPVCFFRPFYGIALWTVVAFLNPQQFTWTAADVFPWAMAVAIPTIAGLFIFQDGAWRNLRQREMYFVYALWIWFGVTTILSVNNPSFMHHAEDTKYRLTFVSKILLMAVLTVPIVNSFARLRWLVLTIAGCFGFFVAKGFPFLILTGGAHRIYGPERSMIADNNDFGLAMNMTLPLFFYLARTEPKAWSRMLFRALFLMTIPVIFFTYSRGALVGLILVAMLMLVQTRQRLVLVPVLAAGCMFAMFFAPPQWKERMDPTREGAVDASAQARLSAWAFSRSLAADYPISGGGFATFTPELHGQYGFSTENIHGAHSVYFQVLAEHGYTGLALYLGLLASCFLTARRLIRQARERGDAAVANYASMFLLSLAGFMSSGLFLGRAYFDYFFTIVACLAALKALAAKQWEAEDAEALEEGGEEEEPAMEDGCAAQLQEGGVAEGPR